MCELLLPPLKKGGLGGFLPVAIPLSVDESPLPPFSKGGFNYNEAVHVRHSR